MEDLAVIEKIYAHIGHGACNDLDQLEWVKERVVLGQPVVCRCGKLTPYYNVYRRDPVQARANLRERVNHYRVQLVKTREDLERAEALLDESKRYFLLDGEVSSDQFQEVMGMGKKKSGSKKKC